MTSFRAIREVGQEMGYNNYSNTRRFIARGVLKAQINPPNTLLKASWTQPTTYPPIITIPTKILNANGRIVLRNMGLFCNFADGLVFESTDHPAEVYIRQGCYSETQLAGTLAAVKTSKTITCPTTGLNLGQYVKAYRGTADDGEGEYFQVQSVIDAASFTANEYPWRDLTSVGNAYKLETIAAYPGFPAGDRSGTILFSALNAMFPIDESLSGNILNATVSAPAAMTDIILIPFVTINNDFLTKSINTAYVGDYAWMDLYVDIEFTAENGLNY
jgi:hypothetical protein